MLLMMDLMLGHTENKMVNHRYKRNEYNAINIIQCDSNIQLFRIACLLNVKSRPLQFDKQYLYRPMMQIGGLTISLCGCYNNSD